MQGTAIKPAAFYIPTYYDPHLLPQSQRDYGNYLLNLLHWKRCNWRSDADYIRLKYDYLLKVVPRDVLPGTIKGLERLGVIEIERVFCPGVRSYGYRLASCFRRARRIVCTNEALNRTIQTVYSGEANRLQPVHRWLSSRFGQLDFDLARAEQIIATMRPDPDSGLSERAYRRLLLESCKRIKNGDWELSCDRFGRVHTPITSLPKVLRCCLLVDRAPMVSFDLANSQPLIAGMCARQYFEHRQTKKRLLERRFTDDEHPYRYRPLVPPSQVSREHPDIDRYIELCERGEFYESLIRQGEDRGEFKKRFYKEVFFGKSGRRSTMRDRFEQRYPSVAAMLAELKRKDYRRASWTMQNYEASIFIGGICNRIRRHRPDIPLFTVHDSFLVRPRDARLVRKMILAEFRGYGVRPTLHKEIYGEHATTAIA